METAMETAMETVDVAVIGAGLAGLTCAQQLRQAGYRVVVIEKSRGLGGRAATRRLMDTCADHGLRYLEKQGEQSQTLIDRLLQEGILVPWTDKTHTLNSAGLISVDSEVHPRYAAPNGMSAIAKELAIGLEVHRNQRVTEILPTAEGWKFSIQSSEPAVPIVARSIVVAIPAPQAVDLLEGVGSREWGVGSGEWMGGGVDEWMSEFGGMVERVRAVGFDACVTAIAVYPSERMEGLGEVEWKALTVEDDAVLRWVGLDSSKRSKAEQPVLVLHSSPAFAEEFFEAEDLPAVGQRMLDRAAERMLPWLDRPELLQVHRWRYAFVNRELEDACLVSAVPLPIVCCGEWCGGRNVEAALTSGMAAAGEVRKLLK